MTNISTKRVLLGGLVAGLVMNISEAALHAGVLGRDTESLYQMRSAPLPNPAQTIPLLVGMTFVLGLVAIWLYAAIYPRIESRATRSLIVGVVVWLPITETNARRQYAIARQMLSAVKLVLVATFSHITWSMIGTAMGSRRGLGLSLLLVEPLLLSAIIGFYLLSAKRAQ